MAEPKRLQFTTVTPPQKPKKKVSTTPLSQRFSLTLTESTETRCPEFSYTELVKNALREKERGGGGDNPEDPFGEDEDEGKLEAIAKALEAKYGPKVKTKKGRPSDRLRDLVDLGDGYDETDDFIDNTEAYDEIVPRCLTTKLGGFYINSGMLDFRYASEDSADDFQKNTSQMKKKRKIRTIESDSDSNQEVKKRGPKKRKLKEGIDGEKKKKKKMMIGPDGEKIVVKRGRKPLEKNKFKYQQKKTSPTVSELLKQQTASTSTPTHAVNGAGDMNNHNDDGYNPYEPATIGSTIEMLLREDSESREGDSEDKKPETMSNLPPGLPDKLMQTIVEIKKAAKQSSEGKCKFFSGNVNKMLLDIEMQSRQVSCGSRQAIYTHLSFYLPCGKETLLKRAKKLRLSQQEDLLRDPINKLKEAVNAMMPTLLEKYEAESQIAALMRLENKEKGVLEPKEEGSTESDDEDQKDGDGKKKRIMGPRKKFEWTDHVRNLLCDVVRVKMRSFVAAKQRGQTAEEYIRCFLDMEIRPIWPPGWIQTRMLYKESRAAHGVWTNPQKQRKSLGLGKTGSPTPTPTFGASRSNNNSIIEIFDSVESDALKEGSGSDKELRLEDYLDVTDLDKMMTEITKTDAPTILDYADKVNQGGAGVTPDMKKTQKASSTAQPRPHSNSAPNSAPVQKSREGIKHGLVSEMLQSPIPSTASSTKQPSSKVLSPSSETPQKSAYMAEFEKHLLASTASPKDSPPKPQSSIGEQSATSKLQSMLVQAQQAGTAHQKPLSTTKSSLSAPHDLQKKAASSSQGHRLSLVHSSPSNILQGSQSLASPTGSKQFGAPSQNQLALSSQQHKLSQGQRQSPSQPVKTSQSGSVPKKQFMMDSKQKDHSSVPKDLVVPSSLSSSAIDQEAVKQLHHQLMQLATASSGYGGGTSPYKSSSVNKPVSNTKSSQESVVGQLFKQPLPANMAAQQRPLQQPNKTSLLKIDTHNSPMGSVPQRHSPQDPLRMSPQGQRVQVQGQKQSSLHMSGGSQQSPTSSKKSPGEMPSKSQHSMGQLSPSHPRSLLGRQSPSDNLAQTKRAVQKDALTRQKEVEKSILEKVIEDYQLEMKQQQHQQHHQQQHQHHQQQHHKVSPSSLSPSQGSLPRTTWQQQSPGSSSSPSGISRMSAFSPPSGNTKPTKPVPHMGVPTGYQAVKKKEAPAPSYSMTLPGMQQHSLPQDLIQGSPHLTTAPQTSHGVLTPGSSNFSSHAPPPSSHASLSPSQHHVPGLPPSPHNTPHLYLHSTPTTTVSALYTRTLPGPQQSPSRY